MNASACKRYFVRSWCLWPVLALLMCGTVWSADPVSPDSAAPEDTKPAVAPATEHSGEAAKDAGDAWENRWFLKWGLANVHAGIKESESRIHDQLNVPFGLLIPGWDRPRTFKDLSNDFELYDLHLALGRDINAKWSWFADVGGIVGDVMNKTNYPLPVPLNIKVGFGRRIWFAAAGVDWYPWGKPVLERDPTRNAIMDALRSSRPFLEGAVGHVDARESVAARLQIQHLPLSLQVKEKLHEPTDYISPRIGVETPIGKNDSLILAAGYLFFDHHPSEINNLSIYVLHSHRF